MSKGINQEFLDTTISPGEDFYQFVNGGWMRKTEIPSDRSSWGSFHELSKNTDQKVLAILEEELSIPGASGNKAARLFETGMNQENIEKTRLTALQDLFVKIETLSTPQELPELLANLLTKGLGSFIHFSIHPDLGDSKIYSAYIEPANLGLPEREYYLDQDEKAKEIRDKYHRYIKHLLVSEGGYEEDQAEAAAGMIVLLETDLAMHMMPKEEKRQIDKLYNPFTAEELKEFTPDWNWTQFFESLNIGAPSKSIVTEPAYFSFLNNYLNQVPIKNIKQYLKFSLIHEAAPYAHTSLEETHFDFYFKTLEGIETMRPRKERLVRVINQRLGELLGQLFVSKHFPPQAKKTAMEMVEDIVESFRGRINMLEWMSPSTKAYALEKLEAFRVKIGYPDTWKDFSNLEIEAVEAGGNYLKNILSAQEWKFQHEAERIGKNVDREEWFMAPQVVNAYYNPMFNEIVFPAAILQPPFFDWEADAAVNYGGIGAVIGHEITHGFDDQGSRFDKEGNLAEWWKPEDKERFQALTGKLINQFDSYYPFEDLPLNGTFTLGENIADLGGLSVAYDALQRYYSRHGKPGPVEGFTADQRFFMSWATVWRTKIRPEALRNQIKTDPHPPGFYRAVAAPSNLERFYHAFTIQPGSRWYRAEQERIKIW